MSGDKSLPSPLSMEEWHKLTDIPIYELEYQYDEHLQLADYGTKFVPRRILPKSKCGTTA